MNTDIEYLGQLEADQSRSPTAKLPVSLTRRRRRQLHGTSGRGRRWPASPPPSSWWQASSGASRASERQARAGRRRLEGRRTPGRERQENSRTAAPRRRGSTWTAGSDLSKIIRDGRIGIVVTNGSFGDAVGDVTLIAERNGGFILSSSTTNGRSGTFVLRIPADRFDRARGQIRDLGIRVRFEQVTGEDVTAEFIDYRARLRILQQRKARLTELAEQADNTGEILSFGRQIDEVQLRIEQIQGQLRFLNDQVAESTLRVSIKERNAPAPAAVAVVDQPDLGSSFELAVQGFLRIVSAVIVGLGYLVPLTVIALLIWLIVITIRRRQAPA